jgi:hypothetical protein
MQQDGRGLCGIQKPELDTQVCQVQVVAEFQALETAISPVAIYECPMLIATGNIEVYGSKDFGGSDWHTPWHIATSSSCTRMPPSVSNSELSSSHAIDIRALYSKALTYLRPTLCRYLLLLHIFIKPILSHLYAASTALPSCTN